MRYPGGKQRGIKEIEKMLPKDGSVSEYREPMIGGGSTYFYARSVNLAKHYWINDKFTDLISFWQTVQNKAKCQQLLHELEELRSAFENADEIKEYFLRARKEDPQDEYRKAFLFFFFNRVTFSGTTRAGGFSKAASLARFTASSITKLRTLPDALARTRITNLDFDEVITKPGNDVFIFLDPPYFSASKLYGRNGSLHEFDHERLSALLKNSSHRFLITYDDCPEIRSFYKWATIKPWTLQYGMNNCNSEKQSKLGSELFIYNY